MYHHITNSKQCEIIQRWRSERIFTEDLAVTISDCRDPWCFCIFTLSVFPKISRVNTQDTPSAKKSSNSFLFNGLSSTSFSKIFSGKLNILLFFFPVLHSTWDFSSPARDWTCAPCLGSTESQHWTTREVPWAFIYFFLVPRVISSSNPGDRILNTFIDWKSYLLKQAESSQRGFWVQIPSAFPKYTRSPWIHSPKTVASKSTSHSPLVKDSVYQIFTEESFVELDDGNRT